MKIDKKEARKLLKYMENREVKGKALCFDNNRKLSDFHKAFVGEYKIEYEKMWGNLKKMLEEVK